MIYEASNRVIEVTVTPDTPGWCRRVLKLEVLSGEPLNEEETARLVAEISGSGFDLISWSGE